LRWKLNQRSFRLSSALTLTEIPFSLFLSLPLVLHTHAHAKLIDLALLSISLLVDAHSV
jgi:hypothetical protein